MSEENNDSIKHIDEAPSSQYGIIAENIDSGVRKTLNTCQYWIKGLPGVCKYWTPGDPGNCTHEEYDNKHRRIHPSGWNNSHCDFLGRKYSCNRYELAGDEDLEQYVCVAPNPFVSGLYKTDEDTGEYKAVPKSDIRGYNADGGFVGRCDGCGLGKGAAGYTKSNSGEDCSNKVFSKAYVVCNYYRPWHIGFGAKVPKTTGKPEYVHGVAVDERDYFDDRLPLSFKVYNVRAKLQKCAYWDADEGSKFVINSAGLYLETGDLCSNTDAKATPYHTQAVESPPHDMLLENVWAEAGCVVCNGARENCPGYTGKWIYCTDDRLEKGDKVSAQQILELRFWMNDWSSQEEYDSVFKRPPNNDDPSTSSIYTYGKWEVISSDPRESILAGKEVFMCIPNARNEFNEDIITVKHLTFINKATTAPEVPNQIQFPSLVRDVEDLAIPPLNIIYPYYTKDPFNDNLNPMCGKVDPTPCVKRYYSVDGDTISVVGYTVRNKTIYAFNGNKTRYGSIKQLMLNNTALNIESTEDRIGFNEAMDVFIKDLDSNKDELLFKATSDSNGFFSVGPINLVYQEDNELVVCMEYNGDWFFRKRMVWSQWHAGAILQCDTSKSAFEHKYGSGVYASDGYSIFTPSAIAAGKLVPLEGGNIYDLYTSTSELIRVNKTEVYSSTTDVHYNFSYCFKKVSIKDKLVDKWIRADTAGSLWLEIDDINLNYIFSWDVDKATVYKEDDSGNITESISMVAVLPSGDYRQSTLPPNCCVVKPTGNTKSGIFHSDGWKVKIDYWYYTLEDNNLEGVNTEIAFPDFTSPLYRFANANYDVHLTDNDGFYISNVTKDTIALAAFFVDDDGRLISLFATKMCVDVARVFARDVEIRYGWTGDYTTYNLEPMHGFLRLDEDGPFRPVAIGTTQRSSVAPCGDHDVGLFSGVGPMWFPYASCETVDFYDVWTGANSYIGPHEGAPRMDYRFVGPVIYVPFCEPHSTLWDCAEDWGCGYHKLETTSVRFTGSAKRRGYVNAELYRMMGWTLPKFGNVLREYVERFKSIDNNFYISFKNPDPAPAYAWMPLVMDNTCFNLDFNCLSATDIVCVNPLNFWLATTNIDESLEMSGLSYERYKFKDVFVIRKMILASYPPPIIDTGGFYPYVSYYYFKEDTLQWAWQELWKDIERNTDDAEKLGFVSLDKPDYIFDLYKEEFQLIADEGEYDLVFTAPTYDIDGNIDIWPSLRLGSGDERLFKILQTKSTPYPSYDTSRVEWVDEGDDDVYRITTVSAGWVHSIGGAYLDYGNMLYDAQAVTEKQAAIDADREVVLSYDFILEEEESYVFNRGIVANLYKNRLKYLPYEETELSIDAENISYNPALVEGDVSNALPSDVVAWWCYQDNMIIDFDFDTDVFCVSKVEVCGYEGNISVTISGTDTTEKYHINQPSIYLYEKVNGTWSSDALESRQGLRMSELEKKGGFGTTTWEKNIDIELSPTRMITHKAEMFRVKFVMAGTTKECVAIKYVKLYYAEYKDHTEKIKLWERKYNVSRGITGDYNPDGEERVLSFEHNKDNSGVYYSEYVDAGGERSAYNKMRSIFGGEHHDDNEVIHVSSPSDVLKTEKEQELLYSAAYEHEPFGDKTNYKSIVPPTIKSSELFQNSNINSLSGFDVTINSERTKWTNHIENAGYQEYSLWYPQGHFYRWSPNYITVRCYLGGEFRNVAQLEFLDIANNKSKAAMTGYQAYYSGRAWHILQQQEKELIVGGNDITRQANQLSFRGGLDLMTRPG